MAQCGCGKIVYCFPVVNWNEDDVFVRVIQIKGGSYVLDCTTSNAGQG